MFHTLHSYAQKERRSLDLSPKSIWIKMKNFPGNSHSSSEMMGSCCRLPTQKHILWLWCQITFASSSMQFPSTCPRASPSVPSIHPSVYSYLQAILWYFLWKLLWNSISIRNKRKLNNFLQKKGQLIFYYNILFLLPFLLLAFLTADVRSYLPVQSFAYLYFICSVVDRQHICRSTCFSQSQYIIHRENRRAHPIPANIHHYHSRRCVVGRKPIPTLYKARPLNQSVYQTFQSLFS